MRITWGAAILALAVGAGVYTTTSIVGAQAPLTQDGFPAAMKTVASTAGSVRTKLMMNQLPDAAKDLTLRLKHSAWQACDGARRHKNRMNGAMLVGPGSTAATARADNGARQARREAWVWGCEQFSDDARHAWWPIS